MTPIIVAEIGCVHLGSLERAKELACLARIAGAEFVKTQKRNPEESVPKELQDKPHPNTLFAYGDTYLEHRKNLELSIDQHAELKAYCESIDIEYACSVWDVTSAREIIGLGTTNIKIPSACNGNLELMDVVYRQFGGKVHISTGMTTKDELVALESHLSDPSWRERTVIYHCTSEYPCPFERIYLRELEYLKEHFKGAAIGFSNHGRGIAVDIAAYILGVQWIERHFVDDRTTRHTDAAASLEPDGLRRLCRDVRAVEKALRCKVQMSDDEKSQRQKLKGM